MSYTTGRYAWAKTDTAKTPKGKVTAKTESQTLVAANENRVAIYITNNGEKPVWLSCGATAAAEEGIRLNEKGGSIVIPDYTGVIAVISKEGEQVVSFSEL